MSLSNIEMAPAEASAALKQLKYRADIDGLRAIAIIPVVLYHAGIQAFGGGFVGVDIFFVISGYLITAVIASDIRAGRFSLARFYERRIRRIFPALFTVVAASCVAAYFVFMPLDFKRFGASVSAMTLFASNLLFWRQSGYFDAAADLKPLLHTWSLAVEEQFYLLFPIILLLISGLRQNRRRTVIILLAVVSFVCSVWQVAADPTAAFYLPLARAWELLVGSVLALSIVPAIRRRYWNEAAGILGIGLIAWSVLRFSAETPFPGINALLPCAGAALIIHSGTSQVTLVSRALSTQVAVLIGLISYSLYLWHWPVIVFAKYVSPEELSTTTVAAVLAVATLVALLSWRFVESPFRGAGAVCGRGMLFAGAAAAMVISISIGASIYLGNGWPQRLPPDVRNLAMAAFDGRAARPECHHKSSEDVRAGRICETGDTTAATASFAILGDSFAMSMVPAIEAAAHDARQKGVLLTRGGCYPLLDIRDHNQKSSSCRDFVRASVEFIQGHPSIQAVVIIGRWTSAAEGTRVGAQKASNWFITDDGSTWPSYEENKKVFARALERTVLAFAGRKLFIVASVPEQKVDVPRVASLNTYLHRGRDIFLTRREFDERQRFVTETLVGLARRLHFDVLDVGQHLCTNDVCAATRENVSLYSDDNHLSRAGAMEVQGLFASVFDVMH